MVATGSASLPAGTRLFDLGEVAGFDAGVRSLTTGLTTVLPCRDTAVPCDCQPTPCGANEAAELFEDGALAGWLLRSTRRCGSSGRCADGGGQVLQRTLRLPISFSWRMMRLSGAGGAAECRGRCASPSPPSAGVAAPERMDGVTGCAEEKASSM